MFAHALRKSYYYNLNRLFTPVLIEESNVPDISHLKPKATGCFLAGSLVGRNIGKPATEKKLLPILARLIDKAINEYNLTKEAIQAEKAETKMTFEEIIKRDQGQFIYTCTIIDHLENCITTLTRIYKIKEKHLRHARNQNLIDIRDSIEHVDERIRDATNEPPVLNISEDSLTVEIAGRSNGKISIKIKDIADEIVNLYNEIRTLL